MFFFLITPPAAVNEARIAARKQTNDKAYLLNLAG
jgi:hypothetical protein